MTNYLRQQNNLPIHAVKQFRLTILRRKTGSARMSKMPLPLQLAVEDHLFPIEKILGPNYKLTLIAKYHGSEKAKDLDLLLTADTRDNMLKVIDRFLPDETQVRRE